jgi:hypothetical protein
MGRLLILILLAAACSAHSEAPSLPTPAVAPATMPKPPPPTDAAALALYDAKQYAACAAMFAQVAEAATRRKAKEDALYSAACCYALDGKSDTAFAMLDRAIAAGLRDIVNLGKDTDLDSLRADPRWPHVVATVKDRIAAWETALEDPALRLELLALFTEDQDARNAWINHPGKDPALLAAMEAVDRKTTNRMKEVVAKYSWPGASIVGEDGAHAAWLLIQHADKDLPFQKLCLANMEPLVKSGDVSEIDYAYLLDRIAVAEQRPQRYGTQFNDKREPQPLEDPAHVDDRRKAIGLGTMAEYKEQMFKRYGPPK